MGSINGAVASLQEIRSEQAGVGAVRMVSTCIAGPAFGRTNCRSDLNHQCSDLGHSY